MLHWLILALGLPDLVALLLFAIPVAAYIAYCSYESRAEIIAFALRIYASFAGVVVVSAAIVYYIG